MDEMKEAAAAAAGGSSGDDGLQSALDVRAGGAPGGAAGAHYSIPGILHFLQHEWSRFEMERSQWEVEKSELQVRLDPDLNFYEFLCNINSLFRLESPSSRVSAKARKT